jgi:hypothetical protein
LEGREHWSFRKRFFGFLMTGFALMWLGLVFWLAGSEYLRAKSAYQRRTYSVAVGRVTDFRPMPYEGHQDECFTDQPARFCYSDYEITSRFNKSASHGGPIREGLPVRVSYIGDVIMRLEVRDPVKSTSQ